MISTTHHYPQSRRERYEWPSKNSGYLCERVRVPSLQKLGQLSDHGSAAASASPAPLPRHVSTMSGISTGFSKHLETLFFPNLKVPRVMFGAELTSDIFGVDHIPDMLLQLQSKIATWHVWCGPHAGHFWCGPHTRYASPI